MNASMISDIHIQNRDDEGYSLLLKFCDTNEVKKSTDVYFLGDIFDLMAGDHIEYFREFHEFFEKCAQFIKENKNIYYFEGNHDVHLQKLFMNYFHSKGVDPSSFRFIKKPMIKHYGEKKIYISHGDELDYKDLFYQRYKKFITSYPLEIFANYILPYKFLEYFGRRASLNSKRRRMKRRDSENLIREKFRDGAKRFFQDNINAMICGHSHILDEYDCGEFIYYNIGFPLIHKKFLYIENNNVVFKAL